jgi:demethylmenaquinone methyltransferase / 2-methoxy-6-polyprenyl-1,4-benzoquinol methylase
MADLLLLIVRCMCLDIKLQDLRLIPLRGELQSAVSQPVAQNSSNSSGEPPAASGSPAWSVRDLAQSPHDRSDKPERVQRMFSAIAKSYDLNNRVHSLWQDQVWRRHAVRRAVVKPTDRVLDVACGTGDLSEWFARGVRTSGAASVTGLDFTPEMLDIARFKAREKSRTKPAWQTGKITYVQGDAQDLRFPDASFDIVSIAFGIRNVLDPDRALREFRRVLVPGGRLIVLEFAEPKLAPVRWFNGLYCRQIMPRTATWISGDRSGAYRYLPKSVQTFLTPDQMAAKLKAAGFATIEFEPLSLGICICYCATVPA